MNLKLIILACIYSRHCTDLIKTSIIITFCFTFYSTSLSILLFISVLDPFRKSLLPNSITQLPVFLAEWSYLYKCVCVFVHASEKIWISNIELITSCHPALFFAVHTNINTLKVFLSEHVRYILDCCLDKRKVVL